VLSLNRAGTTLAAESRASNVITHDATTMKPSNKKQGKVLKLMAHEIFKDMKWESHKH
jgi:hypothetical protein